jgi:hypothetical protein
MPHVQRDRHAVVRRVGVHIHEVERIIFELRVPQRRAAMFPRSSGAENATVIGAYTPNPVKVLSFSRACRSISVLVARGTFTRSPVGLVGSTSVARSVGKGTLGSGFASQSIVTVGPSPAGVARRPSG